MLDGEGDALICIKSANSVQMKNWWPGPPDGWVTALEAIVNRVSSDWLVNGHLVRASTRHGPFCRGYFL